MDATNQPVRAVPPLLRNIAKRGWTEDSARQFEASYGKQIRWQIVVAMERLGMLRFRVSPERTDCLSDRRSELYENTLSDLWIQLLEGLVGRYVAGVQEGRIHCGIVAYLRGVIRHLVLLNARDLGLIAAETPQEMISSFCQSKRDTTRLCKLAWLKFALGTRVRETILTQCESGTFQRVYRAIHHVVDYFFEQFVPSYCAEVTRLGSSVLDAMIGSLLESSSLETALVYVGTVAPYAAGERETSRVPADADEDEYLSALGHAAAERWR